MSAPADQQPVLGQRSDIPAPRARTPSPVKKVQEEASGPLPARDFDIDPATVEVVYAEDEEVFRETAIRELLKVGFVRNNIHEAANGIEGLHHLARLQTEGNPTKPLVVILDVRMPGMDGRECALQIQELVKKKALRREPFVICISSIHRQVIVDEGKGNFQIVLPKPFGTTFLMQVLDALRKWWTMGHGRHLPAWKEFSPAQIDLIAADDEPICRLSSSTAFVQVGVSQDAVNEACDQDDLLELVQEAQGGDATRPLIILLGTESWAFTLRQTMEKMTPEQRRRDPFVVCTSVDSQRISNSPSVEHFHAFLPSHFKPKHVEWCLELCRLWWLTRGDGPAPKDDNDDDSDSEQSEASEPSAPSEGSNE